MTCEIFRFIQTDADNKFIRIDTVVAKDMPASLGFIVEAIFGILQSIG